jgi:1,4-alpha-glucan branching enzyme
MPTTASAVPDEPDVAVVTFHLSANVAAERVWVVGEFNDWSQTALPMESTPDGFEATAVLACGRAYRFRYLIDGSRWENDWAADAYVPNEFGGEDSVVDLTEAVVVDLTDGAAATAAAAPSDRVRPHKRPRPVRIWQ